MRTLIFLLLFMLVTDLTAQTGASNQLWYDRPARDWESEALPIGNGRLGAMLFGRYLTDTIQFNEQSLWSGDNNWDGAYETGDHGFGSYRNFGALILQFTYPKKDSITSGTVKEYRRSLDLLNGIHSTTFTRDGITYTAEAFASAPAKMLVFRFASNQEGTLSGSLRLVCLSSPDTSTLRYNSGLSNLSFSGSLPNHLKFAATLKAVNQGGTIRVSGDTLFFNQCTSVMFLLNARTNYKPDFEAGWRGEDPMPVIRQELRLFEKVSYDMLKERHIADFTRLSSAAQVDIGYSERNTIGLPVDERLQRYAAGGDDPDLEEMLFRYGRYLLISSSRAPGLPANLQGLWNHSNTPPWASDYHSNINLQMNYWSAETTNLAECHVPLLTFIDACRPACRAATRKAFGDSIKGWTARTSQSIFGGNGWEWNIPASAWYMQHVYEHWAFNPDTAYLKYIAYPMMREVCEFWAGRLKEKNGMLMAPDGWSPEHGPKADGVMYDQQVVWDLFRNFLIVSETAGLDPEFHRKIAGLQKKLAPNRIGKWGQLQEWQEDIDDPEDHHRHTSHLFAVFPGCQITPAKTPDLAKAARRSLLARSGISGNGSEQPFTVGSMSGDSRRSWTWPWRGAMWARLGDGEKAAMMIRGLMTYNMLPNLFSNHPPFQIDGNLAIPATMAEMLIQSHEDGIHLLPAIPQRWAAEGYFKGLKARGGFTVDCIWEQGQVTEYRIISEQPAKVKVTCNGKTTEVMSQKSEK